MLAETLIRVRGLELQLKAAALGPNQTLSATAIEALLQIFQASADAFELDATTDAPNSLRGKALATLKMASHVAHRDWNEATRAVASARLNLAIQAGDSAEVARVAHHFPITEAGITAAILTMTTQVLHGETREANAALELLEQQCSGTAFESFQQRQADALKAALKKLISDESGTGPMVQEVRSSIADAPVAGTVSAPWPTPLWKWRELIWTYPGIEQPRVGGILESLLPNTSLSIQEFSNWRPVFWGDSIIHRTPFRIVAFDRFTGQERWSVATDTLASDPMGTGTGRVPENSQQISDSYNNDVKCINGLAAFGLLSCDDEYLYFIDHFEFFRRPKSDEDLLPDGDAWRGMGFGPARRFNGFDETLFRLKRLATRLVAIRRSGNSGLPVVAWTLGNSDAFQYELAESVKDLSSVPRPAQVPQNNEGDQEDPNAVISPAPAGSDAPAGLSLNGHRFLCPPVGQGQHLFTLSLHGDVFWLNCISRTTGHLHWQQSLAFGDDVEDSIVEFLKPVHGTSVCLISEDIVVCSLSPGVTVAVRAADGQLLWATAIRDEPEGRRQQLMELDDDDDADFAIISPSVMKPAVAASVLVCLDTESTKLCGLNVKTGEILWKISRRAVGPSSIGDSADYYIAGISGRQVILVGERHCRSIDLQTGDQKWVVPISRSSGRAECRDDRCLIPQDDGVVLTVDLHDGRIVSPHRDFFSEQRSSQFGAVSVDRDIVCLSTPLSLTVFPRADSLQKKNSAETIRSVDKVQQVLRFARASLLDGDQQSAIAGLRAAITNPATPTLKPDDAIHHFLGEVILQKWGQTYVNGTRATDGMRQSEFSPPEEIQLLPDLNLKSEQQLRAAVMAVLSRDDRGPSDSDPEQSEIAELAGFPEWNRSIVLTENWSVRPDLALNRSFRNVVSENIDWSSLAIVRLRQLASEFVLFPGIVPGEALREQFYLRLCSAGEFAAAEAVAVVWMQGTASSRPALLLSELRERNVIPGYGADDAVDKIHEAAEPDGGGDGSPLSEGLTAGNSGTLEFHQQTFLATPMLNLQQVEQGLTVTGLPDWMKTRFAFIDRNDTFAEIVSTEMMDGSVRDRVTLPFAFHRNSLNFRPLSNGVTTPGLLPVCGADHVVMISCTVADKSRILWSRRCPRDKSPDSLIELGPLVASGFVWHSGEDLHCSHPLTGEDLWVRKLRLGTQEKPQPGIRRIFGDESVVVVMGADGASFERFSMRDGRPLGQGRLSLGRLSDAVTVGRTLLYPDLNARLHLFDGATGEDTLAHEEPIVLGRHNPDQMFQVLPEGRVLMISNTLELILIDTKAARVVFRTPIGTHIQTQFVFGITGFERNGQLFVGIEEQRDHGLREIEGMFRVQEPRINAGPLLCLNPQSGQILWERPVNSVVAPVLFGDTTDLMILWSIQRHQDPSEPTLFRSSFDLQLINSNTGELVSEEKSIFAGRPLRCVHSASTREIEVFTKDALITIRPKEDDIDQNRDAR